MLKGSQKLTLVHFNLDKVRLELCLQCHSVEYFLLPTELHSFGSFAVHWSHPKPLMWIRSCTMNWRPVKINVFLNTFSTVKWTLLPLHQLWSSYTVSNMNSEITTTVLEFVAELNLRSSTATAYSKHCDLRHHEKENKSQHAGISYWVLFQFCASHSWK